MRIQGNEIRIETIHRRLVDRLQRVGQTVAEFLLGQLEIKVLATADILSPRKLILGT